MIPTQSSTIEADFASLNLNDPLARNLASLDYQVMTPIQAHSLPLILNGNDIIAQAKTGSGKTVAFGLGLLNRLNIEKYSVQALVLCPTRELAEQVSQVLRQLARLMPNVKVLTLSGGMAIKPQLDSLRHGAHIIVGTPGRVQKHLDKETLSLNNLQILVLDEADRMLDMGFYDAIKAIIAFCPPERQTLLFSATYPAEIKKLANTFMQQPQHVSVDETVNEFDIEQLFYEVKQQRDKYAVLKTLLTYHEASSAIIFCNTKEQTSQLASMLKADGFHAMALNGDMEQHERDVAIIRFKNQSSALLVATDVAARGLDIKELPLVINFDLAFEADVHTHRIGRTGRAGCKGLALSITTPADGERLCAIEDNLKHPVSWGNITNLDIANKIIPKPEMVTLCLSAGRKNKIRPGDILGALTKEAGLASAKIGKIDITPLYSYVAIHHSIEKAAYDHFSNGKLKGRTVNVKRLR